VNVWLLTALLIDEPEDEPNPRRTSRLPIRRPTIPDEDGILMYYSEEEAYEAQDWNDLIEYGSNH
jgi:hypothetical protein